MPTVKELKAELTTLGLSTDGLKAVLQERLNDHHASSEAQGPTAQEIEDSKQAQADAEAALKAESEAKKAEVPQETAPASSGSYYKQIDGVKYDRGLLELADSLTKGAGDGRISKDDATKLWEDAMDGQGVTDCERRTIQYIYDTFNCTDAGKKELASLLGLEDDTAMEVDEPNADAEAQKKAGEAAAAKAKADADAAAKAAAAKAAADAAALAAAKAKAQAEAAASAKASAAEEARLQAQAATDAAAEPAQEATGDKKKNGRKKKKKKKKVRDDEEEEKAPLVAPKKAQYAIEYVAGDPDALDDPAFAEFKRVFGHFLPPEQLVGSKESAEREQEEKKQAARAEKAEMGVEEPAEDDDEEGGNKMSKKKRKLLSRLSIAQLKQLVKKPDAVEAWDVTAQDPRLLVHLKSYKNSVGVPRHWCQKRKYLQGKRGIDKAQFQLPEFIARTGITEIRSTAQAKEGDMSLKQKQREKMAPKMGKMDIDYQVLHDAFFRYQEKPRMTGVGDLYHEGKEFEIHLKEKRPGDVSEELRKAIGMVDLVSPPPWLINMQRYGPPPSWPNLKIAGLNAPIPQGANYGYHPGGWGKPPVDEFGRPLYGDVFGTGVSKEPEAHKLEVAKIREMGHWGELQEEEEESESEEEEEDEEISGDESVDEGGRQSVDTADQSGASSVISGMETPESLDLRKRNTPAGSTTPGDSSQGTMVSSEPKQLYQVLEQKDASALGGLMGSTHKYSVPSMDKGTGAKLVQKQQVEGVQIALDPSEMEGLDAETLAAKYQQAQDAAKASQQGEDYSDIIEENEKKRKMQADRQDKSKKHKDFKF